MTLDGRESPRGDGYAGHYIVCGGNALAHRLLQELVEHYEVPVVAVVPDREQDHGPRIGRLPGVTAVLEAASVTEEVLRAAGVDRAAGIALMDGEDRHTIHTALAAQGANPGIRIVLRMFNQRLGEHIERLLPNCTALSGSATAAPAFASSALGRPNSVPVDGRYLYVAYDEDIREDGRLCLAADRIDRQDLTRLRLLPDAVGPAAEFIALARRIGDAGPLPPGTAPAPAEAAGGLAALQTLDSEPPLRIPWRSRLRWALVDALHSVTGVRMRLVLSTALAAVLLSTAVLYLGHRDLGWTLYLALLDLAGAAQPDTPGAGGPGGPWARIAQVVITFCGITFMPLATAIVVEALASGRRGVPRGPSAGVRGHVVVVGLGSVGIRVATLVHETGVPVVCVERDPQARGIAAVRALGIPVLVGDAPLASQLRSARIHHARALAAVTSDDAANLEAALEARAVRPDVRIVVRLFDDDFAHHVYATLGDVASRSVSYLSAPAFAAALMGREVLGTLSVYRHVLLVAELAADAGSGLVGADLHAVERPGGVRVLGVRLARRPGDVQWNVADRSRRLVAGDRIVVAATRSGLARIVGPAQPVPSAVPPAVPPSVPPPAGPPDGAPVSR
ncbi:NAD-binding protein [Kitasatospora sp. NBC_01539]|uniref:NAD-binding protein n=1 Tax=Kitasatospora sp. NBC_01539 TaxID=2903577 RepID=UPI0038601BBB